MVDSLLKGLTARDNRKETYAGTQVRAKQKKGQLVRHKKPQKATNAHGTSERTRRIFHQFLPATVVHRRYGKDKENDERKGEV
ncbi:hypothetical protein RUM44_000703 [Polyplax serrata]|uniref:40S ribosomal protein S30 n=1 Tax=Polyplax serrata TaxID=468196 RepID=A0ABR1B627_POLSC